MLKYTAAVSASGFIFVTAALLHHKSKHGHRESSFFRDHSCKASCSSRQAYAWIETLLSNEKHDDIVGAQSRCSGIEVIFQMLHDLNDSIDASYPLNYLSVVRSRASRMATEQYPILKDLDWETIEAEVRSMKTVNQAVDCIRRVVLDRIFVIAEFTDLFTPHLTRVPRDIDGKLLQNKDAGCAPPISKQTQSKQERAEALSILEDNGVVLIKNVVPLDLIDSTREALNIRSTYSVNPKRFETRDIDPEKIFADRTEDVSFHQLAPGRYAYQLRHSALESVLKPLHAGVMPIVWSYLLRQRNDTLLNKLVGSESGNQRNRVFLSEVSLVTADPFAGSDSWHASNGAGGVVVLIPLSPLEKDNGNTCFLPGSHKAWFGLSGILDAADTVLRNGGVAECPADCGDAIVMDSRVMRMTLKNSLFNRSKVWAAFHYDFTDKPAPYQWLPRTLFMNLLSRSMVHMDKLYRKLPPLSKPNPLE